MRTFLAVHCRHTGACRLRPGRCARPTVARSSDGRRHSGQPRAGWRSSTDRTTGRLTQAAARCLTWSDASVRLMAGERRVPDGATRPWSEAGCAAGAPRFDAPTEGALQDVLRPRSGRRYASRGNQFPQEEPAIVRTASPPTRRSRRTAFPREHVLRRVASALVPAGTSSPQEQPENVRGVTATFNEVASTPGCCGNRSSTGAAGDSSYGVTPTGFVRRHAHRVRTASRLPEQPALRISAGTRFPQGLRVPAGTCFPQE